MRTVTLVCILNAIVELDGAGQLRQRMRRNFGNFDASLRAVIPEQSSHLLRDIFTFFTNLRRSSACYAYGAPKRHTRSKRVRTGRIHRASCSLAHVHVGLQLT